MRITSTCPHSIIFSQKNCEVPSCTARFDCHWQYIFMNFIRSMYTFGTPGCQLSVIINTKNPNYTFKIEQQAKFHAGYNLFDWGNSFNHLRYYCEGHKISTSPHFVIYVQEQVKMSCRNNSLNILQKAVFHKMVVGGICFRKSQLSSVIITS